MDKKSKPLNTSTKNECLIVLSKMKKNQKNLTQVLGPVSKSVQKIEQ
jgi:hypothetical protein